MSISKLNIPCVWINNLNPSIADMVNKDIILYGAGSNAEDFIRRCKYDYPNLNILCIADRDEKKHGATVLGIPIVSPVTDLSQKDVATSVIITNTLYENCLDITNTLRSLNFNNLFYLDQRCALQMYITSIKDEYINNNKEYLEQIIRENNEKIIFVRKALEHDFKSLDVFNAKLESSFYGLHGRLDSLKEGEQYFPHDVIRLSDKEVYIDAGAYNGGTVFDFIRRHKEYEYIYAFEPDPAQYEITKTELENKKTERCKLYNLGLYNTEGRFSFKVVGYGSRRLSEDGDITVSVNSLDNLFFEEVISPTFIKIDIEGGELKALEGAVRIIGRDKPKLAISVYHGMPNTHLWEIPYWIKSNFPGYQIYLRQHAGINETICYAIWEDMHIETTVTHKASIYTASAGAQKCFFAENELAFREDDILFCCSYHREAPVISLYKDFSAEAYLKIRERNRTEPLKACAECPRYVEGNWNENGKLKFIRLGGSRHCNFKCEYCHQPLPMSKDHSTKLLPYIKELYTANLIDDTCTFTIASGEPAMCKGMDELIAFILSHIKNAVVEIASNCSVYSEVFADVLKKKRGNILCSVDAGTRETFYKVKNVDCFDKVMSNIKEYAKLGDFVAKYIIYETNYDFKEIIAFFKVMLKTDVKIIRFDLDLRNKLKEIDDKYIYSMALSEYLCGKLGFVFLSNGTTFGDPKFRLAERLAQAGSELRETFEDIFVSDFKNQ